MYSTSMNAPRTRKIQPFQGVRTEKGGRDPFAGFTVLNPDYGELAKLDYNRKPATGPGNIPMRTTDSRTYLRILPTRDDYDADQWAPPVQPGMNVGQWIRQFVVFIGGQAKKVGFICYDPLDGSYMQNNNPAWILRRAVEQRVKRQEAPAGWQQLIMSGAELKEAYAQAAKAGLRVQQPSPSDGDDGDKFYAPLAAPSTRFFVRALVVARGRSPEAQPAGLAPDDRVPVLVMKWSAGVALMKEVDKNGYDFDLVGGVYHCIHRLGDNPLVPDSHLDIPQMGGYEATRMPYPIPATAGGFQLPPPDLSAFEQVLAPKLIPMSEQFLIYEDEYQAQLLSEAFPYEVLEYAFREHPDYSRIARDVHRRTATVEVTPPPPQQPPVASVSQPAPSEAPAWNVPSNSPGAPIAPQQPASVPSWIAPPPPPAAENPPYPSSTTAHVRIPTPPASPPQVQAAAPSAESPPRAANPLPGSAAALNAATEKTRALQEKMARMRQTS